MGRSHKYNEKIEKYMESELQGWKRCTHRTLHNRFLEIRTAGFLTRHSQGDEFVWLIGTGEHLIGRKSTLLSELGRCLEVFDDETVLEIARKLCETKYPVTFAVKLVRKMRLSPDN